MNGENNVHTRPAVDQGVLAGAGVGAAVGRYLQQSGPFKRPRAPFGAWLEPWQMWCIIAAFAGTGLGVAWAGSNMKTAQTEAYIRAEEAAKRAEGRHMDVEFTLRREQERKEADLLMRNQQAVQECAKDGNVPVIGHDFTVVCLSRINVQWEYNMKDPLPWL